MFRLKQNNSKEFIKYENGKLISIEVEEKKKSFLPEESTTPEPTSLPKLKFNKETFQKGKDKIIGWLSSTPVKIIGVLLFFAFFGYSVYQYTITPNNTSDSDSAIVKQTITDTKTEGIFSTSASTSKTPTQTLNTPTSKSTTTTTKSTDNPPGNNLKTVLDTANTINLKLVNITNNELAEINNYISNKTNLMSLQNDLETSYEAKQTLYINLSQSEDAFNQVQGQDLYHATEQRLMNSMKMSKTVISMVQGNFDRTMLSDEISTLVKNEDSLCNTQINSLINFLKVNNIKYDIDNTNKQIKYYLN